MSKKKSKESNQDEFFIMMEDVPFYDREKSYYDQTPEVIDFYSNELRKLREGVTIDGVFIHPWLYWHLNFFKTPIPIPIEGGKIDENGNVETEEVIMNPTLDDHMWYFIENYKRCPIEQKGMVIFGTRGLGKTSIITSHVTFQNTMKENGTLEIVGGSDDDLNAISRLLDISFNQVHPAFLLPRNVSDWKKHIEFGVKTKSNIHIVHSDIFIKNANKGTKKASEKGAGGSPIGFIVDEIGKFDFLSIYQSGLPAFKTQYGWKAFPLLSGTGGSNELSKDAKQALKNPGAFDLLEMDWNILNKMCPEEYRTWDSKNKFGIFAPGQMSYRLPVLKIKTNLADFLGIKSEYLSKVPMMVTDWKKAKEYIEAERERLSKDLAALNKYKMYHPLDTPECFLENVSNPFPVEVAKRHLQRLEEDGDIGSAVEVYRSTEWATKEFSNKTRAEFPFAGGECDAPVVVYGNHKFPTEKPPAFLHVSGLDGYKVDTTQYTDSVGVFYTLQRRNTDLNTPCEKIVCSYAARPNTMKDFHKTGETILETYNSQCCMESIDQGFIQYLDMKDKAYELLTPSISFGAVNSNKPSKSNTKFGIYPTVANQDYMFSLLVSYCKEEHQIDIDEDGNTITKLGIEFIPDTELLKEIINYKKGGNFDRMVAFSHALAWARELDKRGIHPEFKQIKKQKRDAETKKMSRTTPYGSRRTKAF